MAQLTPTILKRSTVWDEDVTKKVPNMDRPKRRCEMIQISRGDKDVSSLNTSVGTLAEG